MLGKNLITAAAGNAGGDVLGVEDVFSTYLYTGTGVARTITNGIDLAGEGGLVWIKKRNASELHALFDTVRGAPALLSTNSTNASNSSYTQSLTGFTNSGFTLGTDPNYYVNNSTSNTFASWTFRKAEKFFDVVTFTKSSSSQTFSHNLGATPGCIIIKRTDSTGDWLVAHAGATGGITGGYLILNLTNSFQSAADAVTAVTSTTFSLGALVSTGGTYVAYLFAHDAGGFGSGGTESVVKCGSFTATAGGLIPTVQLGWEPQWLLIKASSEAGQWFIFDNMRGIVTGGSDAYIMPTSPNAEQSGDFVSLTPTGFSGGASILLGGNATAIYIAIRRGPMKKPTDATTVFKPTTTSSTNPFTTGFPVDMNITKPRPSSQSYLGSRLTGNNAYLITHATNAEASINGLWDFALNTTFDANAYGGSAVQWSFRRAPGFFDVVAYTSDGSTDQQVSHNLGVIPELIIVKERSGTGSWTTYHSALGRDGYLYLNSTNAFGAFTGSWGTVDPTSSTFNIRSASFGMGSGDTVIAYLFATCPGVSKVGSYTGTGTTLNVDCGFASGARFVMIKRTDTAISGQTPPAGYDTDWYVWDTARGIVSGNDPYLVLNENDAENTGTDFIDPLSSGFQISSTAPTAINALGGSFIFLAIA